MTARQFLDLLAASLPGMTAARRSQLILLAPRIAADVPASHLSREMVDAIAPQLPNAPRLDDILRAIRSAPIVPTSPVYAAPPAPRIDEDELDRQWWLDRIASWRDCHPSLELANLRGCVLVLTGRTERQRGTCHPRPRIVAAVQDRIAELEAQGITQAKPTPTPLRLMAAAPPPPGPTVDTRPLVPTTTRKPGQISPEHLAALRAARTVRA
jgi:hypothetical protein